MPSRRVVILGGGFGGTYAALRLDRTLAKRADLEVVLISRENYFLFTPMLHEVAAGELHPPDIISPLRKMLRRVRFIAGEVARIDLKRRQVSFEVGALRRRHELTYDHLVLALGSETNYFGMADVEAHAVTMKSLADAELLRNRMVAALEEAAEEEDRAARRRLLTFVVAGGGFAGVETIGAMNDFLRETIRYYPGLESSMLRVVLVHAGKVVLPELGERLGLYAQKKLRRRGVDVRLQSRVSGYQRGAVQLLPGGEVEARTLVWTAGATPAAAIEQLSVEKLEGRVKLNEFLEVPGHEGVLWAVGDCAAIPDGKGALHPPTAQHALREAAVLARNIEATVDGTAKQRFRFATIGQLATIGRRDGVARVFGMRFSGFLAWWLWRTIYLAKLPGLAKKLRVALSWSLDLLFTREIEQLVTVRDVDRMASLSSMLRTERQARVEPDHS
jgi:NADH dehydrogenase